jgi:NlpC/P60 family putative phage cell wall peptidase
MNALEAEQRAAVVAEARSWLGTPYHHRAEVKGAGVDCARLLHAVYRGCGLVAAIAIPPYPPDWHLHRGAERYLAAVLDHAAEIAEPPLPGDIALWRFGRCFSHGAIVVAWPTVIHAYVGRRVALEGAERAAYLARRPRKFFTLKLWAS